MAGFGDFEEDKHPRGEGGKFTSGGGGIGGKEHESPEHALADESFLAEHGKRLKEAADSAGRRLDSASGQIIRLSHEDAQAAGARAMHAAAAEIIGEQQARKADLVPALPSVVHRAREGAVEANNEITKIAVDIEPNHKAALTAVHELEALRSEEHDVGADVEIDVDALRGHVGEASNALHGDDRSDEYAAIAERAADSRSTNLDDFGIELEDGDPVKWDKADKPERFQYEDNEQEQFDADLADYEQRRTEHERSTKEYTAARDERRKQFDAKAIEAQDALEALHEKQVAALGKLKDTSKKYAKDTAELEDYSTDDDDAVLARTKEKFAGKASFDEDEGQWSDPKVDALYSHARRAYERDVDSARQAIEDEGFRGDEDTQQALKESIRETADAIKELAKYNKRPAKLAKPPKRTKKSANRPGWVTRESVGDMAPAARFKLTLSKLDFLSLVDHPAQQTASIRLIKRAGAQESVEAAMLARIVKVGEGDDPLLYCWAFTCTDESGQPYHDLQGDAVSPDFIRAAEEFVKAGGAVDEMHDGAQKSRIAFAYPMDSEIASAMLGKAAGSATKISGLMVAIRPTTEQLAKVRAGEFNGVSIAGAGIRELMKGRKGKGKDKKWVPYKRRVSKMTVLTSITDGHQHAICLDDPEHAWTTMLSTSYATSEGADQGHSHPWTYDATTGAITIGEDSNHTHTTDEVVPAEVMAEAADDDGKQCPSCGAECDEGDRYCCYCGVSLYGAPAPSAPATPAAPSVVVVSARANSPRSGATPTVKSQEQVMATEQENKIAELQKQNARLEKLSSMSDAQRIHFGKLSGSEADSFLAKSSHERDLVLSEIAKADEAVYTSPIDGAVYRKSDDRRLIEMAKRTDEAITKQRAAEAAEREATFAKRGDEVLTNFAKGAKGNVRARIMKALNTEFVDPAEYEEAMAALKGANYALGLTTKSRGYAGDDPELANAPSAQLRKAVEKYQDDHKLPSYEIALMKSTESDPNIRKLYDAARAS
jgi:hypothetical protein